MQSQLMFTLQTRQHRACRRQAERHLVFRFAAITQSTSPACGCRTFGLIVGACDFHEAEDTGHSSEARVGVRVLQTGHGALQDVQHAFVHLPAHLLRTKRRQRDN